MRKSVLWGIFIVIIVGITGCTQAGDHDFSRQSAELSNQIAEDYDQAQALGSSLGLDAYLRSGNTGNLEGVSRQVLDYQAAHPEYRSLTLKESQGTVLWSTNTRRIGSREDQTFTFTRLSGHLMTFAGLEEQQGEPVMRVLNRSMDFEPMAFYGLWEVEVLLSDFDCAAQAVAQQGQIVYLLGNHNDALRWLPNGQKEWLAATAAPAPIAALGKTLSSTYLKEETGNCGYWEGLRYHEASYAAVPNVGWAVVVTDE
ncbi:hypothetical protein [Eubacterium barkeri]|uniref:Uncharacterized protein n=1 Tax=Eubacterium barkeri TaxID=1528 RepID=A0A1H3HTE1_EUBBA|nr:hypothetical protein [Eubacterium barkeri]SDY18776.1 hypothetical protein SAMN04488579_11930 [Eubacterium barkeri]